MVKLDQKAIARLCGVSQTSVWAALSDTASTVRLSQETRRRIIETARRLGYRPHAAARRLRQGRTYTLLFAWLGFPGPGGYIARQTIDAIGRILLKRGYALEVITGGLAGESSTALETALREHRGDGVFLGCGEPGESAWARLILEQQVPACLVEGRPTPGFTTAAFDYRGGARAAVDHLLAIGRRRVAFIGPRTQPYWASERLEGYLEAHQRHGLRPAPDLISLVQDTVGTSHAEVATTRRQLAALCRAQPRIDAIFAAHDVLALVAMWTLQELGRRVPEDVAIVGFDDIPLAEATLPRLTTVRQDPEALGRLAVDLVIGQIEGRVQPGTHHVVPTELIVRESTTGRVPGSAGDVV